MRRTDGAYCLINKTAAAAYNKTARDSIPACGKNDIMCNCCNNCEESKCRLAVTVEDNFAPCTFPKKYFDVEIRSKDGCTEIVGKVPAGGSQVFDLPCGDGDTEYSVTVTGDPHSAPRAQTRRVCCCCGRTSGVTFIFMTYEPDCEQPCVPCPPPCPPPCCPPCPPPMPCIEVHPKPPSCPCEDIFM